MIVIFSNNQDYSTFDVMKWLHFLGEKNVVRINSKNLNDKLVKDVVINYQNNEFSFVIDSQTFRLSDIDVVWYRKGIHWLNDEFFKIKIQNEDFLAEYLTRVMKNERQKLGDFINYLITENCQTLGNPFNADLNKLIILEKARKLKMRIPDFLVSNSIQFLKAFITNNSTTGVISKALSDGLYKFDEEETKKGYFTYTEEIHTKDLDNSEEVIAPSFLQKKIKKNFEVRSFFLDNRFYSMAIFSQNDDKTKVDFRKYNAEKPNRFVPYILPDTIEQKLKVLFADLALNTGSVDILVDENDQHYFLEINPVGQFGMVSDPCNYFLEKKVAQFLLKQQQQNENYQINH